MNAPPTTLVIALAGPSGSGKSMLARRLQEALGFEACTVVPVDHFYRDFSALPPDERARIDFDDPAVLDSAEIARVLDALIAGRHAESPLYDFTQHARSRLGEVLHPAPILIVEGIFALHLDVVRRRASHLWYLDVDADTCLQRRIARDVRERGRTEEEVRHRFETWVRPSMERFVAPQLRAATLVIDGTLPVETMVDRCLAAMDRKRPGPPAGGQYGFFGYTGVAHPGG